MDGGLKTLKFILIGDSGVGKSSLTYRLCDNLFLVDHAPTIGLDFKYTTLDMDDGTRVKLQVWDTAGQDTFLSLTTAYYRGSQAAIVCFDLTNRLTYEHLDDWYQRIRDHSDHEKPIPCILVGCKSDLANEQTISLRQVGSPEAMEWAEKHGFMYMETSAKTAENVQEVFQYMAAVVLSGSTDPSTHTRGGLKTLPGQRKKPAKALGGGMLSGPAPAPGVEKPTKKGCSC